jgi:sterol desaturase/sphingolipid hydroxylase (fatty acid hydroxylase superfamily)/uncharacterized protein (DUF2147 family)
MATFFESLGRMFGITAVRYFILAGIPFLLFYILLPGRFTKAKIQARAADKKDFLREVAHSMVSSLALSAVAFCVLFTPLRGYTQVYTQLTDYPWWWIPVSIVLSLVIHDTYFYWMHRALHHKSIFRYTHLVHHQSVNPSPWAAYSFHILEAIAEGGIVVVLAFVLPLHPLSVILFTVASFVINVYGHLGYEIMPRSFRHSFWFGVFNTSVYHNLHHSKFKGNYGLYFRFWDRLLHTQHPGYVQEYDRVQQQRFGNRVKANASPRINKKSIAALLLVCCGSTPAFSQIEGNWKDRESGAVIRVYYKEDKLFGEVVKAGNPKDSAMMAGSKLMVLNNFLPKDSSTWCCGKVYDPHRKITADGKLKLLGPDSLKVTGSLLFISESHIWTREN